MLVSDMKKSQNMKNLGISNGEPPPVVHLQEDNVRNFMPIFQLIALLWTYKLHISKNLFIRKTTNKNIAFTYNQ